MSDTRTVLEHPDFIRVSATLKERAEKYQHLLSGHPKTALLAAQAARTFYNKELRRLGLDGLYCSNQKHTQVVA